MLSWAVVAVAVVITCATLLLRLRVGPTPATAAAVTPNRSATAGRPLGLLERWYSASADVGMVTNFALVLSFNAASSVAVTRPGVVSAVQAAADAVAATFPVLCTAVVDDFNESPQRVHNLARLPSSHDRVQVGVAPRPGSTQWCTDMPRLHATPLRANSPLFAVTVLAPPGAVTDFEVVLTLHHAVADGVASVEVARTLALHVCRGLNTPGAGGPAAAATVGALPPPLDCQVCLRPTLGRVVKELAKDTVPVLAKLWPKPFLGPPHVDGSGAQSRTCGVPVTVELPLDRVTALRGAARRNGCTLHGVLCAAAAFAAVECLDQALPVRVAVQSAVSLRGTLPRHALGAYVCGVQASTRLAATTRKWAVARAHSRAVADPGRVAHAAAGIGLLAFVPGSWRQLLRRLASRSPNGRTSTVEVSNLGAVELDRSQEDTETLYAGGVQLRRLWFSQDKHGEGGLFAVSAVTCRSLCVTVTAPLPLVSPAAVRRFGTRLADGLRWFATAQGAQL